MKITKLVWCALCAAVLAAFSLVGCEEIEIYSVPAPSDLQHKIDSIAAAKPNTGDTTYLNIATALVGAEDNSAGWWSAFSDYFAVPANKVLRLEFVNHGTGINNWNNWNLAVTNAVERGGDGYAEYFILRADAFGWGNSDFKLTSISQNYPPDGDEVNWDEFRATMQGAYVSMDIDHSTTGTVFITATAVGTNGITLVLKYQQTVSATEDIWAFLVADGSHFEMKKAYLLPSKVTDTNPVSITITGAPVAVELGDENFWGDAVATVTYDDGSTKQIDSVNLSFNVIPDMTTTGVKTVIVAYNKTRLGAPAPTVVSTFYTLEVTNAVTSLAVTTLPNIKTYYFFSSDPIIFNTTGIVVTATYSDGSTGVIPNANLKFGKIPAAAGAQSALISYEGSVNTVTTTCPLTLIKGIAQVGANDFSTPFWTNSADVVVPSGESKSVTLYCYSDNAANWHSPYTVVRKADNTEYAVVRMDHFGWGTNYATATATSDWNWGVFQSSINGSKIVITVTNNGDNTADILYNVTYVNGETHFQKYAGMTVDSADLKFTVGTEGAYLVFVN